MQSFGWKVSYFNSNFTNNGSHVVQMIIYQHWFRLWFGAEQATSRIICTNDDFYGGIRQDYTNLEPLWRHQMETLSVLLALCAGPSKRPVTRSFNVFFDLRLNKQLSKQSRRKWFVTPSPSLWRHCNDSKRLCYITPRYRWLMQLFLASVP